MTADPRSHDIEASSLAPPNLKAILDATRDAILVLGSDNRITYSNSTARRLFQDSTADLASSYCWEVVHGTDGPIPGCPCAKSRQSLRRESAELQVGERWLLVVVDPLLGSDGEFQGAIHIATDITERRHAAELLAESEERFRALVEQSPVAISIHTPDGRTSVVNSAWRELWEVGDDAMDEILAHYNVLEDAQARELGLMQLIEEAFAGESVMLPPREYDARKTIASIGAESTAGRSRWINSRLYPVADPSGAIRNVVLMEEDITDQVQAVASLRASQAQYATVVEGTTDGIVILQDGLVCFVNSASPKLLGYSSDELVGTPFVQHVAPGFRDIVMQRHGERVAGREPPPIYEIALLRKDSTQLPVEINATQIEYENAPAALVFLRDISERKRVEKTLRERDQEIRDIVESSRDWIWALDLEGRHTFSNPASEQILGYSPSELVGRSSLELMHPEDREMVEAQLPRWIQEKCGWQDLALRWRHKDGTWRWLESNAVPITDAAGEVTGFRGVDRDITERRRAEQDLRTSLEATIQADAGMIETRDPYTSGHQSRVAQLAAAIARHLDLSEEQVEGIRVAAVLHDIGKLTIPAEILSKPGAISEIEFALIQQHPAVAHGILKEIVFPWPIAEIVLQHHERLDGSGYPEGLASDAIRLEARIIAVADTVEAMSSHRPYRPALGIEAALDEIEKRKGKLYDSATVDACTTLFREAGFEFSD